MNDDDQAQEQHTEPQRLHRLQARSRQCCRTSPSLRTNDDDRLHRNSAGRHSQRARRPDPQPGQQGRGTRRDPSARRRDWLFAGEDPRHRRRLARRSDQRRRVPHAVARQAGCGVGGEPRGGRRARHRPDRRRLISGRENGAGGQPRQQGTLGCLPRARKPAVVGRAGSDGQAATARRLQARRRGPARIRGRGGHAADAARRYCARRRARGRPRKCRRGRRAPTASKLASSPCCSEARRSTT